MDWGLFRHVAKQLPVETILDLHQTGEPLLHPDIVDFCMYGVNRGHRVEFSTNGLLLDHMLGLINNVDVVTVSLMDTSAFESVKTFLSAKGDKKPVVFIKAFLKQGLKVYSHKVVSDMIHGGSEVSTAWMELLKLGAKQKFGQIQDLDNPPNEKNDDPCPKLLSSPVITWDGKVLLCCRDFFRKTVTGDVTKEPLGTILQRHEEIYEEQKGGYFKGFCKGCNHLHRDKEVWKLIALNEKQRP